MLEDMRLILITNGSDEMYSRYDNDSEKSYIKELESTARSVLFSSADWISKYICDMMPVPIRSLAKPVDTDPVVELKIVLLTDQERERPSTGHDVGCISFKLTWCFGWGTFHECGMFWHPTVDGTFGSHTIDREYELTNRERDSSFISFTPWLTR